MSIKQIKALVVITFFFNFLQKKCMDCMFSFFKVYIYLWPVHIFKRCNLNTRMYGLTNNLVILNIRFTQFKITMD